MPGATLTAASDSVTWDPEIKDEYPCNFKLIIRQILLGREAKEGEYNVVQVETMSQRDAIKIPIAVLRVGETRFVSADLEFPDAPVTFKLIEGSGPVHIHGQHLPGTLLEEIEEYGDEMEEEMVDEEEAVSGGAGGDGPHIRKSGTNTNTDRAADGPTFDPGVAFGLVQHPFLKNKHDLKFTLAQTARRDRLYSSTNTFHMSFVSRRKMTRRTTCRRRSRSC